MLTRHVRIGRISLATTTRSITSTAFIASSTKPSWLETKGRTRSFLFDEDNPVTNKEAHKLHKVHLAEWTVKNKPELAEVLQRQDVKVWQSNPYLSMLASPIRKCMWSDKVMPRDFLLPIKAAVFESISNSEEEEEGKPTSKSKEGNASRVSIFPRALLHPAFTVHDESRGKKDNRGYVICKKSAMHDFSSKGSWKRLDRNAMPNPYLVYQVESQLRERVLQELKLLTGADAPSDSSAEATKPVHKALFTQLPKKCISSIRETRSLRQDVLQNAIGSSSSEPKEEEGTFDPPAALFEFTSSPSSESLLVPEGQFSTLLTYEPSILEGYRLQHLPRHRIPVYSIPRLFELDFGSAAKQQVDETSDFTPPSQRAKKEVKKESDLPLWSDLHHTTNLDSARNKRDLQIYNAEVAACERRQKEFNECLLSLLPPGVKEQDLPGAVIAVPSLSVSVVPLLKALWRYRMWVGEGWSGGGFGILEATGRKKESNDVT